MSKLKTILAFPFQLMGKFFSILGKLIMAVLIVSLILGVIGVSWFMLAPTNTPIGQNTSRAQLLYAEINVVNKMPNVCKGTYFLTSANHIVKPLMIIVVAGPILNTLNLPWFEKFIPTTALDTARDRNMNIFEEIKFTSSMLSTEFDFLTWKYAHSGLPTSTIKFSDECTFPSDFVIFDTPQPGIDKVLEEVGLD